MTYDSLFLVIAGMAVVTYIPRMLPFVLFREIDFPSFVQDVLENLRYAILGCLIFPGIFLVQEDIYFGLTGGTVALVLAYLDIDIVLVVLGTVGAMTLYTILL